MRKRTLLTVVLIGLMLMIAVLVLLVVILVRGSDDSGSDLAAPEKKQAKAVVVDPYAGMEVEAIEMVQNHEVLSPAYVEKVVEIKERNAKEEENPRLRKKRLDEEEDAIDDAEDAGEPPPKFPQTPEDVEKEYTTIQELVSSNFLEEKLDMSFLERGNWRALHLETDKKDENNDDPFYEVYLDYIDGEVKIGPVWIVNVETGEIVPRNEMAEIFELTPDNVEKIEELRSRPERVVRAITNHKFESGIELGGVILQHFVSQQQQKQANNKKKKKKKEKGKAGSGESRIVGWTVNHDFRDKYNAYFQWIEDGEPRVAQFRFDWGEQRLEPRGLNAIDLMVEGDEKKSKIEPVQIWPEQYENDLNIPRRARWKAGACKERADEEQVAKLCNSLATVLEEVDFIESVQWLLTKDEDTNEKFKLCKANRDCTWIPKPPKEKGDPYVIEYKYVIGGKSGKFSFKVDPESGDIEPVDDITRWAYFSVTPRT